MTTIQQKIRMKARGARKRANMEPIVQSLDFSPVAARKRLVNFTRVTHPQYTAENVHYLIASYLEKLQRGEIYRLMIFAPPQHGKSELASVRFPAYWLGKRPNDPIIMTGYAASLTEDFSAQARDVVLSEEYQHIFPGIELSGTAPKDFWRLENYQGYVRAAGVGGGITGRGAMLGLIDDPIASWAEAQSETTREKIYNWYKGTFRTRIWEGGGIGLIMTRWHEEDLAGKILRSQPGQWTVVRLPAIAESQEDRDKFAEKYFLPTGEPDLLGREEGEVLSPQRFSQKAILEIKKEVGSMVFSAEYQGSPRPPEGTVFKSRWFKDEIYKEPEEAPPIGAYRVRYWDKAGTAGGGKYTVGLLMCLDENGVFWIEDIVREQMSPSERNKMMLEVSIADSQKYEGEVSIWIEREPGSSGVESAEISVKELNMFDVHIDPVSESKGVRLRPFAAQLEAGNIRIVRGVWNNNFVSEALEWSEDATYKDQIDSASGAFNKLILARIEREDYDGALAEALRNRGRGY